MEIKFFVVGGFITLTLIYTYKNYKNTLPTSPPFSTHIYIKGGGLKAFWYNLGFIHHYLKYHNYKTLGGYSSGSLVAAVTLCDIDINELHHLAYHISTTTKLGYYSHGVRNILDSLLPYNAHNILSHKLEIIVCDPSNKFYSKKISSWNSRDHLIDCLVSSCFIPLLSDTTHICDRNTGFIDGGLSLDLHKYLFLGLNVSYIDTIKILSLEQSQSLFQKGCDDCKNLISK